MNATKVAMNNPEDDQPFQPQRVMELVRAVIVGIGLAAAGLALLLALVNQPDWWRGLLAAGIVSLLAAGASLPPLIWGLRRGVNQAVAGYFIAMGVRAVVSLGGCVLAIVAGGYPAAPTLLLMVVFYFVVLGIESTKVARTLWSARL